MGDSNSVSEALDEGWLVADHRDDTEQDRLRQRLHKMTDQVQAHALLIHELRIMATEAKDIISRMQAASATRDHLEASVQLLRAEIAGMRNEFDPIRRAIYWFASIVLAAVAVAVLGMVLRS